MFYNSHKPQGHRFTARESCLSVRPSVCLSVCLSVCPSICQTRDFRQNERKICPDFLLHERSFSLVFEKLRTVVDAYYVTVVEDRPILSVEYRLPLLAKTDPPCNAVSATAELLGALGMTCAPLTFL